MKNIFEKEVTEEVINRINTLTTHSKAKWGKMNVSQMLAHCNIQYETIYESNKFPKPNGFVRLMLRLFVKGKVVGSKPYKKNGRTAPYFVIDGKKDFNAEKERLIDYLEKTQVLGVDHLLDRDAGSFGKLKVQEWSNFFYKHIDHHLQQFGV